jgi:heavy metal sensor kinase
MFSKIGTKVLRRTDLKLTLWYIVTFSLSVLLLSGIMYLRVKHQLIRELDRFILDETKELVEALPREEGERLDLVRFENETATARYYPFFFRISDDQGSPLYVSKRFGGAAFSQQGGAPAGKEIRKDFYSPQTKKNFRIISTPVYRNGKLRYVVEVATHLEFVRRSLGHFKENLLAILPVILALGSLGGWLLARKSLSPLGYIVSKTESITSKNLGERLSPRGTGDELDHLIETINGMIARLEASFRRMAEFTADASHELKTPLCAMRGEAEVLLSRDRSPEEYQESLARMIEQFDHLNQMINDLILLSKSDAAHVELRIVPLRLDLLLQDLCTLFQVVAEQKGIVLRSEKSEPVTVQGDKVRLQQLFINLIDNAIKYTSSGSVQVTVKNQPDKVLVEVRDTGIGIPVEEQAKVFKRFYRVDKSRSKETGGVGLGLSIAGWVAAAHGGKIDIRSRVGEGTTFSVTLPASPRSEL